VDVAATAADRREPEHDGDGAGAVEEGVDERQPADQAGSGPATPPRYTSTSSAVAMTALAMPIETIPPLIRP
jgi:hypothetical protein